MEMFRRSAIALCFTIALAAPAASHQAPFLPPKGWVFAAPPAGFIGKWIKPGSDAYKQNVSVLGHKFDGSLADFHAIAIGQLREKFPGGTIAVNQDTTVCGDHPAKYVSYGLNSDIGPMIIEQIETVENGAAYIVTYARLATQDSDPAARDSLTTICGV
ncbi:MAG TPA: hypothetical protein VKT51_04060 [Candidatus Eremiobacteraceae bacterium]|nr:hypothetical protein [Candidatus Eremiobacteraceae bacterium]